MSNSLPITIRMGALPLSFQGTPQEIGDAIAARLTIVAQQSLALFATGAAEPFSDVGPWLDTGTSPIGVWKNWDDVTGRYQPITLIDEQLGYILSVNAPDPLKFKVWVKLLADGRSQSVNTFFGGAWTDVYTDRLAALQLAIDTVVTKPYGPSGRVYTSTGVSTPPVWSDIPSVPVAVWYPFAGTSLPANHLWCLGQVVPITLYPLLFSVIGTAWGGDGVSNFGIPDTQGRTVVGTGLGSAADATNWLIGEKRGTEKHLMSKPEMPIHSHAYKSKGTTLPQSGSSTNVWINESTLQTSEEGGDQPHNNTQPSIATNWIIKYA